MSTISLNEQAAIVRMQVNELEEKEEIPAGTIIFRHESSLYFVARDKEFNSIEEDVLERITETTHLSYASAYPKPLDEHVVGGEYLVMSPAVLKATIGFLAWVRFSDDSSVDEDYVLILPGALVTAAFDEGAIDEVESYIYFPVQTRLLEDADRMQQAQFAVALINGLARNMHVVFDGQVMMDVIPNTPSRKLVREYEESLQDDDTPVIREQVEQMYAWSITQAEVLRIWLESKNPDVLPPEVEVVNYSKGVLGNQIEGFVMLYADEYEVPDNMLDKIKDGDIFD